MGRGKCNKSKSVDILVSLFTPTLALPRQGGGGFILRQILVLLTPDPYGG